MRRRFEYKHRELEDFLIRFYPAGNYTWVVPGGCTEVDVFLVGRTINADINGAFNIIRKSEKESFDVTMLPEGRGFWWNPVRISV